MLRVDCSVVSLGSEFATRFWRKVDKRGEDECWPWTGTTLRKTGRGQVYVRRSDGRKARLSAPSVAWQLTTGKPIPVGQIARHSCDNPNCCNPRHVLAGTQSQNIGDCVARMRRNAFGRQALQAPDVLTIRARAATGERHQSIADDYGVKRHSIGGIVNGHSWKHLLPVEHELAQVHEVAQALQPLAKFPAATPTAAGAELLRFSPLVASPAAMGTA